MRRTSLLGGLIAFGLVAVALADEKKLTDDSPKRAPLPGTFQAWMLTGKHVGRFHSPVCEIGLHPMALVFTRDVTERDQPLAELLKKLDQSVAKHAGVQPGACAVFLTDGEFRDAVDKGGEDFNKRLAQVSVAKQKLEETLKGFAKDKELSQVALALAAEAAVKDYNLDEKAAVTVLLCHHQDVLARYDLPREKLTDDEAAKIAGEFEKLLQRVETPSRTKKRK